VTHLFHVCPLSGYIPVSSIVQRYYTICSTGSGCIPLDKEKKLIICANIKYLFFSNFVIALVIFMSPAMAASDADFPKDWKMWPVVSVGEIPSNKATLPQDLPPIVLETIKTYNWINDGDGSKYSIRVHPEKLVSHKSHTGDFEDGPTSVLELTDIKAILVTSHLLGEPQYGVFTFDGKDISDAHHSLAPEVCQTCHSGYGDSCVAGVCSR
jgi:hypothetical protein